MASQTADRIEYQSEDQNHQPVEHLEHFVDRKRIGRVRYESGDAVERRGEIRRPRRIGTSVREVIVRRGDHHAPRRE